MATSDHYDVIVIGTGAGGGTLAHTLAASGKRILLLERGDFLPRETRQLESRAGLRRRPVHLARDLVRRRRRTVPAAGALLRRRRHQALRRGAVPPAPAGLRRDPPRRRHLAGLAAHLRRLRAVVHEGRVALPGARQPRRGPDRGSLVEAVPVAGGVARAAHPADLRRAAKPPATTPSRRRAASCSTRPTAPAAPASAARGATATRAWSTPSPTPRRSPSARCSTPPTSTLLVDAEVLRLETDPTGRTVTGVVVSRAGAAGGRTPPTSSSCRPGASNSAKLLLRSANDAHPNGLANGSDQVGRNYMFHNSKAIVALAKERNDTVFQKTLGINDFYLDDGGRRLARSATSRWSASPTAAR